MIEIKRCKNCEDVLVKDEPFSCDSCGDTLCGYCCEFKDEEIN